MAAMIATTLAWLAGNRRALMAAKWGAIALTVLLFLLSIRRTGERAGRMAERLETMGKAHDVQRQMLEAEARRPRGRGELAQRLRDGRF
jgi:hypothetical protein